MNRIGFMLKVKQDKIEEYKEIHKEVWPEMLEALSESGWHNYSLFMRDDGWLFGYFESPHDFHTSRALMAEKEINTRWQTMMAPFFEPPPDRNSAHADTMMITLEQVFYLA